VTPAGGNALHPTAPGAPVMLQHAAFGVVTGDSGKKLSSRDGTDATLGGLLAEARGAAALIGGMRDAERQALSAGSAAAARGGSGGGVGGDALLPPPPLTPDSALASAIAHSAVRYFDLAHSAPSNYRLSFDAALSLRGNTASYLMYGLARLASIRRP
jgi:arginyl-tRNA synthetase